jgi:hypothetical protein
VKNYKINIASFLLLFSLFALNSGELFHHHEHEGDRTHESQHTDSKCQACLFNHTLHTTVVPEPALDLKLYHSYNQYLTEETETTHQNQPNTSQGRAPPIL